MEGIPNIIEYGSIYLQNFDQVYEDQTADDNTRLSAYYIMPRYDCNLPQHLKKFEGVARVSEILSISKQIINILKIVHTSKRVHNDIKPENVMVKTLEDGST